MVRRDKGTPFQQCVWEALTRIPKGQVTTYGAIARYLGNYSGEGGVKRKQALLESEGVRVKEGKIVDFEWVLFDFHK